MVDLRPLVLERLGAPQLAEDETLDESWENAYGPERDAMLTAVTLDHWQACTDPDEVSATVKPFPPQSKRLIALLFAESCGHLTNEPHPATVRRIMTKMFVNGGSVTVTDTLLIRDGSAERPMSPANAASWYAWFGGIDTIVRITANCAAVAATNAGRFASEQDAMNNLIGPDGPLKSLVESPLHNSLIELRSRWPVALECAHRVFK